MSKTSSSLGTASSRAIRQGQPKNNPQAPVHLELTGVPKSSVISPSSFSSPMSFHAAARLKRTARKAHHSASKSALGMSALRPKLSASKSNKCRRRSSGGNVEILSDAFSRIAQRRNSMDSIRSGTKATVLGRNGKDGKSGGVYSNRPARYESRGSGKKSKR